MKNLAPLTLFHLFIVSFSLIFYPGLLSLSSLEFLLKQNLGVSFSLVLLDPSYLKTTLFFYFPSLFLVYLPLRQTHYKRLVKYFSIYLLLFILGIVSFFFFYDSVIGKTLFLVFSSTLIGIIFGFISYPYFRRSTHFKKEARILVFFRRINHWCLFILCFTIYGIYSIFNHYFFGTTAWDLGIYTHAVWQLSQLQTPEVLFGNNPNILGTHFELYLLPISLIYRFWSSPYLLLLLQSLALAIGVFPVYKLASEVLKSALAANLVSLSYIIFFGNQAAIGFDFHPLVLAAPFLAYALYYFYKDNSQKLLLTLLLAILAREDVAIFVSLFGLYLLLFSSKKSLGVLIALFSLAYAQITTTLIMPNLSSTGPHALTHHYSAFGKTLPEITQSLLTNPLEAARTLFSPETKFRNIIFTLASFSFLPLVSFKFLFLVWPLFLEKYLTSEPNIWSLNYHYTVYFGPYLIFGSVFGVYNVVRWLKSFQFARNINATNLKISLCFLLFSSGISLSIWGYFLSFPLWSMSNKIWVLEAKRNDTTNNYQALKLIPKNASVNTQSNFLPHLANRDVVDLLNNQYNDKYEYLIINLALNPFTMEKRELTNLTKKYLASREYGLVFSKGTTLAFRKGARKEVELSEEAGKYLD